MNGYERRLLDVGSSDGSETDYSVITVVFTDLPADRAESVFDEVLGAIAVPSYVEDGIVVGPFYDGNQATAIQALGPPVRRAGLSSFDNCRQVAGADRSRSCRPLDTVPSTDQHGDEKCLARS